MWKSTSMLQKFYFFFWNQFFISEVYALQSAKTNMNVEEVFFSIAKDIKQRLAETDSKAEVHKFPLFVMTILFSVYQKAKLRMCNKIQGIHILFFFSSNNWWTASLNWIVWLQPQTIKINQPDQAGNGGQAPQKSACCGS